MPIFASEGVCLQVYGYRYNRRSGNRHRSRRRRLPDGRRRDFLNSADAGYDSGDIAL